MVSNAGQRFLELTVSSAYAFVEAHVQACRDLQCMLFPSNRKIVHNDESDMWMYDEYADDLTEKEMENILHVRMKDVLMCKTTRNAAKDILAKDYSEIQKSLWHVYKMILDMGIPPLHAKQYMYLLLEKKDINRCVFKGLYDDWHNYVTLLPFLLPEEGQSCEAAYVSGFTGTVSNKVVIRGTIQSIQLNFQSTLQKLLPLHTSKTAIKKMGDIIYDVNSMVETREVLDTGYRTINEVDNSAASLEHPRKHEQGVIVAEPLVSVEGTNGVEGGGVGSEVEVATDARTTLTPATENTTTASAQTNGVIDKEVGGGGGASGTSGVATVGAVRPPNLPLYSRRTSGRRKDQLKLSIL